MQEVYVVMNYDYSDTDCIAVYKNKEDAEKFAYLKWYDVEAFALKEDLSWFEAEYEEKIKWWLIYYINIHRISLDVDVEVSSWDSNYQFCVWGNSIQMRRKCCSEWDARKLWEDILLFTRTDKTALELYNDYEQLKQLIIQRFFKT